MNVYPIFTSVWYVPFTFTEIYRLFSKFLLHTLADTRGNTNIMADCLRMRGHVTLYACALNKFIDIGQEYRREITKYAQAQMLKIQIETLLQEFIYFKIYIDILEDVRESLG